MKAVGEPDAGKSASPVRRGAYGQRHKSTLPLIAFWDMPKLIPLETSSLLYNKSKQEWKLGGDLATYNIFRPDNLIDKHNLLRTKESDFYSTTFIMNYWKGGGPRNVYTLSLHLKEAGYPSKVFSFYSFEDLPNFIRNRLKLVKRTYGADTINPTGNLSRANIILLPFTNPTYLTSLPFLFKERVLEPITLSRHETNGKIIATNWQTVYPIFDLVKHKASKMLYFTQAYEADFSENYFYKKMAEKTYRLPITRFTQSKWLADYLDSKYGGETHYIGHGIAHDVFKPLPVKKSRKIATIVRRDRNKGFELFVKGINKLWSERKDFEILLLGEPPDFIKELIRFPYTYLGWISDDLKLAEIYNECIFVNTGTNEALPMPPLEAMSCGSSVVMTDIPGSKEYALDHKNCIIANPADFRNISSAISELLDSDDLRKTISRNAIETAKNYDWKKVLVKLTALLNQEKYC
jgi:glycosyltransferase involved in cell wall biosynthesis